MADRGSTMSSFELATYLLASARDCMEEPLVYGPLRMLVAVDIIADLMERGSLPRDEFLLKARKKIWDSVIAVMNDRVAFAQALDTLLSEFAEEFKNRIIFDETRSTRNSSTPNRRRSRGRETWRVSSSPS